jgi:hypothetical protein
MKYSQVAKSTMLFLLQSKAESDGNVTLSHFTVSTGRQFPIIAGQSSWTQESIGLFTQPGHLAGRLPDSARSYPLVRPKLSISTPGAIH